MTLYVGNLPFNLKEEQIESMFGQYGSVLSVKIIMDRDTGRSKGFGFVEMESDQEGNEAINNLNGAEFSGRKIRVNEANDRR